MLCWRCLLCTCMQEQMVEVFGRPEAARWQMADGRCNARLLYPTPHGSRLLCRDYRKQHSAGRGGMEMEMEMEMARRANE
jgi:hypothetical protein